MPSASEGSERVLAIDAPHFNAGLVLVGGKVIEAAPILRYMLGWELERVLAYCRRKGWSALSSQRGGDPAHP